MKYLGLQLTVFHFWYHTGHEVLFDPSSLPDLLHPCHTTSQLPWPLEVAAYIKHECKLRQALRLHHWPMQAIGFAFMFVQHVIVQHTAEMEVLDRVYRCRAVCLYIGLCPALRCCIVL